MNVAYSARWISRFLPTIVVMTLGVVVAEEGVVKPSGVIGYSSLAKRGFNLYVQTGSQDPVPLAHSPALDYNAAFSPDGSRIAFASERDGNVELYCCNVDGTEIQRLTSDIAMDDHPSWSPDGTQIAFASTRLGNAPGRSWTGVYVMNADGSHVRRVSPERESDFSPAWSPDGKWIAFSSHGGIGVMSPTGDHRRMVTEKGGWPAWIHGDHTLAFHREVGDNRWDVMSIDIDGGHERTLAENASMPRASVDGKKLSVVIRGGNQQQIGLLDVHSGSLTVVTEARTDHWNPAISPDGKTVVYHKIADVPSTKNIEHWSSVYPDDLKLVRIDGAFPAFSSDGSRIAFVSQDMASVDVMQRDGSRRTTVFEGTRRTLFGVSWSHGARRIAFSHGKVFAGTDIEVNIKSVSPEGTELAELTTGAGNNGFPSYSPDGKQLVFRSGRDGKKNLYVMDSDGANVRRLTDGDWTDTMCDWSHDGKWITFASDRDGNFDIWLIRSDGTELRKLVGEGGRDNHPHFSPDDQWIVFTSQRAGLSAESVSVPRQPQAYGELFIVRVDGTDLTRLTHNSNEEGTPAWGK